MGLDRLPPAPEGSFEEDDGFVLVGAHTAPVVVDSARPVPSAPALPDVAYPSPVASPVVPAAVLPGAGSTNDSVRIAYETAGIAVQLDMANRHAEAVKSYTSAIANFNWCLRQGLIPDEPQIRSCLHQYSERKEVLERNVRHHQGAGGKALERPTASVATSSGASAKGGGDMRKFGWDGTTFSGARKRQFEQAEELSLRADLNISQGSLKLAKENLIEAAELLVAFSKSETDKKKKIEINEVVNGLLVRAEGLQKKVCKNRN